MRFKGGLGFLSHHAPTRGIKLSLSLDSAFTPHERILVYEIRTNKRSYLVPFQWIPTHFCNVCAVVVAITCFVRLARVFLSWRFWAALLMILCLSSHGTESQLLCPHTSPNSANLWWVTHWTLTRNYWYYGTGNGTYIPRYLCMLLPPQGITITVYTSKCTVVFSWEFWSVIVHHIKDVLMLFQRTI